MKTSKVILGSFILIILTSAIYAQQSFVQTVTRANKNCNAVCSVFEVPELDNKPHAIIFITPIASNYKRPIGAYYMYLNKWSVFNLDGTAMAEGDTFKVEYFIESDSSHFVYVVPKSNQIITSAYIDHVGLNNNPSAQVRILPTNPPGGGAVYNSLAARASYDTTVSKWYISNLNNTSIPSGAAYNIMFALPTLLGTPETVETVNLPPLTQAPPTPASLPLQVIVRTEWAIPNQSTVLQSGQCRYVGSYVNTQILATDSVIATGGSETLGDALMWSATVQKSLISIRVCNWRSMTQSASTTMNLNGRKLNILVLR